MTAPSGCLVALGSSGSPVVFFKFCLNWLRSVLMVWLLMEMPSSVCCSRFSMALRELVTLLFSASSRMDRSLLAALASSSDAIAAGSGWGRGPERGEVLSALLDFPGALLLDADALIAAAADPERWMRRNGVVFTPHPGEAGRLAAGFGVDISPDRVAFARALAERLHAVTVLKGAFTEVASPDEE